MVFTEKVNSITRVATTAVVANRFLTLGLAGACAAIAAEGADSIGVGLRAVTAQNITDGDVAVPIAVFDGGIVPVEAGAAIDVSSGPVRVTSDSVGRAIAVASDNDAVLGWALESAGAAGVQIAVLLDKGASSGDNGATHFIFAAGQFTTAGGDAAEVIPVTGLTATDLAFCQLETEGASPVTLDAAAAATGQINVTMSADPSTDHIISYMVLRAR